MSVFGDFQRVWVQRFPESALPAAWEEDVRANLAKHKQKVAILREELEKEEFYVEYLETLLSDVEKHKAAAQGSRTAPPSGGDVNDLDDKPPDSKQVNLYDYTYSILPYITIIKSFILLEYLKTLFLIAIIIIVLFLILISLDYLTIA